MIRIAFVAVLAFAIVGCSSPDNAQEDAQADSPTSDVSTSSDASTTSDAQPTLTCAATSTTFTPNPCPAPSGAANEADFCFRPQWTGVKQVDVYGQFNLVSDWKSPFVSLTDDGSGTWVGKATVSAGSYPYVFRVHGSADNLVKDGTYLLDQENPSFTSAPSGAPLKRSVSLVTVPQSSAAPLRHLTGTVVFEGAPQPCYTVSLDVGEIRADGGAAVSEHTTANYLETGPNGTFDFPLADGDAIIAVRYPFLLAGADAGYPDPMTTPSVGIARTGVTIAGADVHLDDVDISYSSPDYAKMSPTNGSASLPVTFTFSVVSGSNAAYISVTSTNIAGNDPSYASPASTATSTVWDGGFGGGGSVVPKTQYWWGAWQRRAKSDAGTPWTEESLLFPVTFD